MMEIKKYTLSPKAEKEYRINAKRDKFIPFDVLEKKISTMIYAGNEIEEYPDGSKKLTFGTFVIHYNEDIVIDVWWLTDSHNMAKKISKKELAMMFEGHKYFGLNDFGNGYAGEPTENRPQHMSK